MCSSTLGLLIGAFLTSRWWPTVITTGVAARSGTGPCAGRHALILSTTSMPLDDLAEHGVAVAVARVRGVEEGVVVDVDEELRGRRVRVAGARHRDACRAAFFRPLRALLRDRRRASASRSCRPSKPPPWIMKLSITRWKIGAVVVLGLARTAGSSRPSSAPCRGRARPRCRPALVASFTSGRRRRAGCRPQESPRRATAAAVSQGHVATPSVIDVRNVRAITSAGVADARQRGLRPCRARQQFADQRQLRRGTGAGGIELQRARVRLAGQPT